jgi:hypothetical protein
MSDKNEAYKGKLPRPSKTQTVKEFEDEEIKPDAEYTEFSSVAEILAKPQYFKIIIDQPEFQAMLKREGIESPDTSEPKATEQKKDDDKGKSKEVKKAEEPDEPKPNTEEDEPKTSIDVVMVPSLEEISPPTEEAVPEVAATTKMFIPKYRRVVHNLTSPVSIDVSHGLGTFKTSGLEDIYTKYSGDRKSKKGSKVFKWLQTYRPMGVIAPIKYDSVTGMVSSDNHSYMFDTDVAGNSAAAHKYEINRLRPKIADSFPMFTRNMRMDPSVPDALTTGVEERTLVDLSTELRIDGERLKSADIIANPWRFPMMLRDKEAYRYMSLTFDDWRRVHGRYIEDVMLQYVRERNAKERDERTNTTLSLTLYDRFVISNAGANSQDYYYNVIPNSENVMLCETVLNRSFNKAMEAISTIAPSQRSISTNITNRQASHMLLNLTSVQPSDGANFAKHLGAFLLGGKRRALEVDIDDGATKTPLLNALSSFASLIMLDERFVDERTYRQLMVNVLLPFFDEFPTQRQGDRGVRVSMGVHQIADDLMRIERVELPEVTKVVDLAGRGRARAREIRAILTNLLTRVRETRYVRLNERAQLFKTEGASPFIPFNSRDDIVDIVLFGTRGDGEESRMHEVSSYRPEAIRISSLLEEFADVLGRMRQYDGVGLALTEAMKTKTHLPMSMAIFNDAFVHGSTNTELQPAVDRRDIRARGTIDSVMLPFDGALSFLLYGIGSSEVAETNNAFVRFKAMTTPLMPSLYPVYLYFERAIAQSAYREFNDTLLITHRDMVVEGCIDALAVYFESVDPESKERIEYLFDERRTLDQEAGFELPAALTSTTFAIHEYTPILGKEGALTLPGSFDKNNEILQKNERLNAYEASLEAIDKTVTRMYIDFKAIEPMKIETYNSGTSLIYAKRPKVEQYINLRDIITSAKYIDSDKLSIEAIKNLAYVHMRRRREEYENVVVKGVYIDDIKTSFKFVEHTGLSDIVAAAPTITIDRSSRNLDTDFEVSEISIYYHRITDRQGELTAAALLREREYLSGFMTHVSIDVDDIQKCLVNFNHSDPMNPSIYKLDLDGTRIDEDSLADVKIRDGRGITYAGRLTLSTRDSETLTITDTLSPREVLGQQGNRNI